MYYCIANPGERMKVIAASGYFDPLHRGHVEYLKKAKKLGDKLIVIVNNDEQAKLKKNTSFIVEEDRLVIIEALDCVDEVFLSIDRDLTVCKSLAALCPDIFAKGGDRYTGEIPEATVCKSLKIEIVDGLGKKIASSSDIVGRIKDSS